MLSKEAAIANATYIGYASPNSLVYNNEDYIEGLGDAYDILYGCSVEKLNANYDHDPYYESFTDTEKFGTDMQYFVNGLWEQLKTETEVELWVHVFSITTLVVVLVLASYSVYIKKKRSRFYRYRDRAAAKKQKEL
jgi:hypothetical protein